MMHSSEDGDRATVSSTAAPIVSSAIFKSQSAPTSLCHANIPICQSPHGNSVRSSAAAFTGGATDLADGSKSANDVLRYSANERGSRIPSLVLIHCWIVLPSGSTRAETPLIL